MGKLSIIEHKEIRVLTTQQIADAYGTSTDTITKNFNRNKERYVKEKHYICLEGEELKEFKTNGQIDLSLKLNKLYLWTQKGAFLHAKSLNTDKAWEAYEYLIDYYFSENKVMSITEQIQLLAKGNMNLAQKIDVVSKDLQEFKHDMPILGIEESKITNAVRLKGVYILGGKESNAYRNKSTRSKVYSDLYNQIKRNFGVSTYKAIKRSQCNLVFDIIKNYEPPVILAEEIKSLNV